MQGMYYFDHDNNAHNDDKMRDIRRKFGSAGYGNYWILVELMHKNNGFIDTADLEDIAYWERIENIEEFVDYCIEIQLFRKEDTRVYSKRMVEDIKAFMEQQDKKQSAANQRWNKRTNDKTHKSNNNKDINKEETQKDIIPDNINEVIETLNAVDMQTQCTRNANAEDVHKQNENVDMQTQCTCNANANQNKKKKIK